MSAKTVRCAIWKVKRAIPVADMFQYVKLDPKILLERFRDRVKISDLDEEEQKAFYRRVRERPVRLHVFRRRIV